jgi:CubicO group peptidase (beta-lactamase class C family)
VWRRIRSWRMPPERAPGIDVEHVTLRHLLSHGAGFSSFEPGYCDGEPSRSALDLLRRDDAESRTFRIVTPPGRTHRYAAGGYLLAELLMDDATGIPFPSLVRELVLQPLGMRSSDYTLTPALAARLATRHDEENRALPPSPLKTVAASGMYTTAEDLATLLATFAPGPNGEPPGRGVISPASCAEMLSTQTVMPGESTCGLGFYLRRKRSDLRYSHAGRYGGWYGHGEGFLRRRVVVVALSNGDRGISCVEPIVRELRAALYDLAL